MRNLTLILIVTLAAGCVAERPPLPPADDRLGTASDLLKSRYESEDRLAGHLDKAAGHVRDIRQELRR